MQEASSVNEWLSKVESQMRLSLSSLLNTSVARMRDLPMSNFNVDQYLAWMDEFPAQIVSLSAQVCV